MRNALFTLLFGVAALAVSSALPASSAPLGQAGAMLADADRAPSDVVKVHGRRHGHSGYYPGGRYLYSPSFAYGYYARPAYHYLAPPVVYYPPPVVIYSAPAYRYRPPVVVYDDDYDYDYSYRTRRVYRSGW